MKTDAKKDKTLKNIFDNLNAIFEMSGFPKHDYYKDEYPELTQILKKNSINKPQEK